MPPIGTRPLRVVLRVPGQPDELVNRWITEATSEMKTEWGHFRLVRATQTYAIYEEVPTP